MNPLDDPRILELDRSQMFVKIAEVGSELVRAWEQSAGLRLPAGATEARSVVLAGMGGSATAGDYLAALCRPTSPMPIQVVRDYGLPAFVDGSSLVVVSSYSGETEEALSLYAEARARGAAVLAITTGGQLAVRATADGVPVHTIRYESLPRAAIAHTLAPLLRLGAMLGISAVTDTAVRRAGAVHSEFVLRDLHPDNPASRNGAKRLAGAVSGRTALVIGAEHLAPVAARFKNQLAENGKALAAVDYLPELDHNVVVGLETGAVAAEWLTLVSLESQRYDRRTRARCDVTAAQFAAAGIPVERIEMGGDSLLAEMLVGTAWGDYVSCYVALLNGLDPTPIRQIDLIKAALAKRTGPA